MLKNALADLGLSDEDISREMENFEMEQAKVQINTFDCLDSDDCNCPDCEKERDKSC